MILKTVGSCFLSLSATHSDDNVALLCAAIKFNTETSGLQRLEFQPQTLHGFLAPKMLC